MTEVGNFKEDIPPNKKPPAKGPSLAAFEGIGLDTEDAGGHGVLSLLKGSWHGETGFNVMTVPLLGGDDHFIANGYIEEVMTVTALDQMPPTEASAVHKWSRLSSTKQK
jgi:hypothetical protein